ncbi:MAG: Fic family protein [Vulcanibacillus sp.]
MFNKEMPFNDLPLLPPIGFTQTENLLLHVIDATRELAELKVGGKVIPNQLVLLNTIPLIEAKMSSEIENIVTTQDEIFRYASINPEKADSATKEALMYKKALIEGAEEIKRKPINENTMKKICSIILNQEMDIRNLSGTFIGDDRKERIYTPPEDKKRIQNFLNNWSLFAADSGKINPLISMAILHYQYEAIHPFSDGNGRTGRILNILYLIQKDILEIPILYLSKYILEHKSDYYTLLNEVTSKNNWNEWIEFMLVGTRETAKWTKEKVMSINKLLESTKKHIRERLPNIYSHELVELLFTQPYCRINNLVEANIVKRQSASEYLGKLVDIGILTLNDSRKTNLYINKRFYKLLTTESNEVGDFTV